MNETERRIGPYRILTTLGEGGMGVVYRAIHVRTGRLVALKTVRLFETAQLENLRRELHVLSKMSHPGIVQILDSGIEDSLPWVAMKLVEGKTLRHRMVALNQKIKLFSTFSEGFQETQTHSSNLEGLRAIALRSAGVPISSPQAPKLDLSPHRPPVAGGFLPQVLTLVRRICVPLAYLHGEGIVHRDLKPANVMLQADERPVLVDFGLNSRFGGQLSREKVDAIGSLSGTVAYMSPEQGRGELVDARADLYSLGCILYEMLTGRKPFPAASAEEVLQKHSLSPVTPPSYLVQGIQPRLEELVLGLLAKHPQDRIGHADDVAASLADMGAEDWPGPKPPLPRPYLYRPSFVGRQEPLEKLKASLKRLFAGQGCLVLVGGESGVGKTRLALELLREARLEGILTLVGESRPEEAEKGSPLHSLRRPLRSLADRCLEQGLEKTEQLLGPRGPLLALYEPAFERLPGQQKYQAPVELAPEPSRMRLQSYLTEVFAGLASERPCLLMLDDLQWADDLTLGWLRFLVTGRHLESIPLLILGTYRTEDVARDPDSSLEQLLDLPLVQQVDLGRLDPKSLNSIVGDMLALVPPPPLFGRYLNQRSDGNPFFAAEMLRTALAEGLLYRSPQGRWMIAESSEKPASEEVYEALPLPRSLQQLVLRRLEGLEGPALELVSVGAVLGRAWPVVWLRQSFSGDENDLLSGLHELVRRQILEDAVDRLQFVHDQIREVAYARLDADSRRRLHARVARVLEGLSGQGSVLAMLGQHWAQAGEPDRARTRYLEAAKEALSQHALSDAESLFRAALALPPLCPDLALVRARQSLALDVLAPQGKYSEALLVQQQCVEEARALKDLKAEAAGLCALSGVEYSMNRPVEALQHAQQALALQQGISDVQGAARSTVMLGRLQLQAGNSEAAKTLFTEALQLAREIGDRAIEAGVLINIANLHRYRGEFDECLVLSYQAKDISRSLGRRDLETRVVANLSSLYAEHGNLEEAAKLSRQTLQAFREMGDRFSEAINLNNMGTTAWRMGAFQEAAQLWRESVRFCRQIGHRGLEANALSNLAAFHAQEGETEASRDMYHAALAIARETEDRFLQALTLLDLAILERQSGELKSAEDCLEEAEAGFRGLDAQLDLAKCYCERGHLALARGQSADEPLEAAREIALLRGVLSTSELVLNIMKLEMAMDTASAGKSLVNGERFEDLPAHLKKTKGPVQKPRT